MMAIKQSICWWCFDKLSPEEICKAAVDIGYPAVELVFEENWPIVKDHGLAIAAIGGHGPLEDGLNKRSNHERIQREIETNLEKAVKWGIRNLIVFSGNRNGISDEEGLANTVEGLHRVAKAAEDAGIMLVLELLNSKVDHPDYQCDHTDWGVKVCQQVDSPNVKLLYDIYHMQIMEGDVIRTIQDNHQWFGHYHTAGVPGRHEINETQELYYPPIIQAILATGYDGYLGQEFVPTGDPIAGLRQAYAVCDV
ncbi:MAG: TIM barrel protein [Anaerolineae bacterium]|nr:TIM barrel protein [Anaerolineae bacterium]